MAFRRVSPGGAWRPRPAQEQNAVTRAAEQYEERLALSPGGVPRRWRIPTDLIRVRNTSGQDLSRGHCVRLDTRSLANLDPDHLWCDASLPSYGKESHISSLDEIRNSHGILRRPVKDGAVDMVECQVDGCCLAIVNVTDTDHRYADLQEDDPVLASSYGDGFAEILETPTETGEQELAVRICRHGVYPPVELITTELIYSTSYPFGAGVDDEFSRDYPGEFRFGERLVSGYDANRVGEPDKAGVVLVQDQTEVADEFNGPSLILKQGCWRLDVVGIVTDLELDSSIVSTDLWEWKHQSTSEELSSPYDHKHDHTRWMGANFWDRPKIRVSVRHDDLYAPGTWLFTRVFPGQMDADISALVNGHQGPRLCALGGPMILPLSRNDYQLKFDITLTETSYDHVGTLDLETTRIILQRIDSTPWSNWYESPTHI